MEPGQQLCSRCEFGDKVKAKSILVPDRAAIQLPPLLIRRSGISMFSLKDVAYYREMWKKAETTYHHLGSVINLDQFSCLNYTLTSSMKRALQPLGAIGVLQPQHQPVVVQYNATRQLHRFADDGQDLLIDWFAIFPSR